MPLACADVGKRYGGLVALDGVSFTAGDGQVLGIAGPNGAGKTTLLDVLSGHQRPDRGQIELNGRGITTEAAHRRARVGVARTFQSPLVPKQLTVAQTLAAASHAHRPKTPAAAETRARRLARLDAPDDRPAGLLDTLQRRKLLLACLLLRDPAVLLLDEPCSGLLEDEVEEVGEIVRAVIEATGAAVVIVEHRLEVLFAVAERVVVMDRGRVIAEGPPLAVFDEPVVRTAYFEPPKAA